MPHDALVRARAAEEIEAKAKEAAALLDLDDTVPRDLLRLVSGGFRLLDTKFRYEVCSDFQMPGADGMTLFDPVGMRVPERVHRSLKLDGHRARFTIAHELGHIMMHPYQELNRAAAEEMVERSIPCSMSAEWQANTFAGAFLMPVSVCRAHPDPVALSKKAFVSPATAEIRLKHLGLWRVRGEMSERILRNLEEIRRAAGRK